MLCFIKKKGDRKSISKTHSFCLKGEGQKMDQSMKTLIDFTPKNEEGRDLVSLVRIDDCCCMLEIW